MKHIRLSLAFTCVLAGWTLSCNETDHESFVEVLNEHAKLIASFESYENISTIQQRLKTTGLTWSLVENNSTVSKDSRRPPFHIYVIKVHAFKDSGQKGDLRLEFFNDRLMATWFYPENFTSYRSAIEERYREIRGKQSLVLPQHVRITFARDYEDRDYIAWEDIRLREQVDLWIKRYS